MRLRISALSTIFVATVLAAIVLLVVFSGLSVADTPSQGSLVKGPGLPEEDFPAYSQIVDNSSEDRFDAPGWETGSSSMDRYGEDYRISDASTEPEPARYKVKIPETDTYSVFAWWPAKGVENGKARYGVSTTSGVEWSGVRQGIDGGSWVKLGEYEMESGDSYSVQIAPNSAKEGNLVADAIAVVRGVQSDPPNSSYDQAADGEATFSAQGSGPSGKRIIRVARNHIGTRYVYGGLRACRSFRKEDCSCHTRVVFKKFGKHLKDSPVAQRRRGVKVRRKRNLRRGDLVFFDENFNGRVDHVGIYSGNGHLVHASSYFGKVVEKEMKYIRGFKGGRRLKWG